MTHGVFSGVMTAIATPFTAQQTLDLEAFKNLLKMQKKAGIHGVVVAGTTGESPTLSTEERFQLVQVALQEQTAEFHIYVGTGTNDTKSTLEQSIFYANFSSANGARVDGIMIVAPYYNRPNQTGLFEHFKTVCKAVGSTPVCIYNVPGRTGCTLAPTTFFKLALECENILAIKEAAGDVLVVSELAKLLNAQKFNRKIEILSGDDTTYAPALLCGATGVISVSSHLIPGAMLQILKASQTNDFLTVQKLHLATLPLNSDLFCAPNPIGLKWALASLKVCQNTLRLPLTPLEAKEITIVQAALDSVKSAGIQLLQ